MCSVSVKPGQGQTGSMCAVGPWLCRLTDMFTPDRKCSADGLPKQRGSKVRGVSRVIYLSAAFPSRVQPEAGHTPGYSQR